MGAELSDYLLTRAKLSDFYFAVLIIAIAYEAATVAALIIAKAYRYDNWWLSRLGYLFLWTVLMIGLQAWSKSLPELVWLGLTGAVISGVFRFFELYRNYR